MIMCNLFPSLPLSYASLLFLFIFAPHDARGWAHVDRANFHTRVTSIASDRIRCCTHDGPKETERPGRRSAMPSSRRTPSPRDLPSSVSWGLYSDVHLHLHFALITRFIDSFSFRYAYYVTSFVAPTAISSFMHFYTFY